MTTDRDISRAAERLQEGGVVAFPTETVYGLGADAFKPAAVDRVFTLKGRPRNNPLIVHVSGPEMARRVAHAGGWSDEADRLARAFWPGPLSILVPRSQKLPREVTAGSDLVAVRCPNHPVALALLFEFGGPLIGPSANLSGHVSPTSAQHVRSEFSERDVLVLDGGDCAAGIESSVVDLSCSPARLLRPGLIGPSEIAEVIGRAVELGVRREADAPLLSPGLLDRHYAPKTPAFQFAPSDWPRVLEMFPSAAVLSHRNRHAPAPHAFLQMPDEPHAYARTLYAALRTADALGLAAILVEEPPSPAGTQTDDAIWAAIADRLRRATQPLPD